MAEEAAATFQDWLVVVAFSLLDSILTVLSFVWSAGAVALAYKHQVGVPPVPEGDA